MFYQATTEGDIHTFQQLLQQDPYLLDLASFPYSRNLLYVATLKAQVGIVEDILRRNPLLARDSDSQKWSLLHIAAVGGYVDVTSKLLAVAPEMLWSCDGQGMNPFHVAAMNGHAEIIKTLVRFDPAPAKERMGRGQTALHLCVKHGQLEALKVLMDEMREVGFAHDDDGETLLHLAIRYKRVEVMKYLVTNNKINKRSLNSKGETTLDIMDKSFPHETSAHVESIREKLMARRFFSAPDKFFLKMSKSIMVVMILITTMAFQSTLSPSGGVWQEDSPTHKAGEAVMSSLHPKVYKNFVTVNTIAFITSLISIFLLTTNLPSLSFSLLMTVMICVWISLTSMAVTYAASVMVITPQATPQSLEYIVDVVVFVSLMIVMLVYARMGIGCWLKKMGRKLRGQVLEKIINQIQV